MRHTPRVVCGSKACDNRPKPRGSRRLSLEDHSPEVPRAAWHRVAGDDAAYCPGRAVLHADRLPICIRKQAFPASVRVSLGDAPDAVVMRGRSAIITPLGKVLAGPHCAGETLLTADLDLHDIGRGTFDFDVTGHYGRPDMFQLIVHEAPTPAVVTMTGECVSIGSAQCDNPSRVG